MRLEFLLLVAAAFPSCLSRTGPDSHRDSHRDSRRHSRATPRLLPAPLVLQTPPEQGPPRIRCLAPRRFSGSTFELFQGVPAVPVQSVPAAPDRHWAEFSLPGAARCLRCRYRSHNGSTWLDSELSSGTGSCGGYGGGESRGESPSRARGVSQSQIRCFSPQIWAMPSITPATLRPRGPHPPPGPCRKVPAPSRGPIPAADPGPDPGDPPLPSLPSRSFLAPPGLGRCRRPGAGAAGAAGGRGRSLARWEGGSELGIRGGSTPGPPSWAVLAPGATGSVPHRPPAAAWAEPHGPGPGKAGLPCRCCDPVTPKCTPRPLSPTRVPPKSTPVSLLSRQSFPMAPVPASPSH